MRWPGRRSTADPRVIRQVASWFLRYPDDSLLVHTDLLRAALAQQPDCDAVRALEQFADHVCSTSLASLRDEYVHTFDLSRKQTLYLTYWTDGDTRRRGSALLEFKEHYRRSGMVVDLHGELPDHLPIVLEYAALADPEGGHELLTTYRPALELIRFALLERDSPYADVLAAVCATLPGDSPPTSQAARELAPSRGVEAVGLEPFDPRLLPLSTVRTP